MRNDDPAAADDAFDLMMVSPITADAYAIHAWRHQQTQQR